MAHRIVHIIETLGPGGAERALYTTLKHLDADLFKNTVITVFSEGTHWVGPINKLGVEVTSLGCRSKRDLPVGFFRLLRILRRMQPHVVHTHLLYANLLGRIVGRLRRTPVISSVHSPTYEPEVSGGMSSVVKTKLRVIRALDAWTARNCCTRMLAVSEYVRDSVHRRLGVPDSRLEVLYNPIDLSDLTSERAAGREDVERELQLDEDCQILLNVGRVTHPKGLLYAVRAMPAVLLQWPKAHLLLAGATNDKRYVNALRTETELLGIQDHVHILGTRRDVAGLLGACDLFIFPSIYEGHGIALAEAMATGCACIAFSTGPIPEVVEHGVTGWLVPPCNVEALAGAICCLLANPQLRARLGRAAKGSAVRRFHPQPTADRLAEIYGATVAKKERIWG